MGYLKCDPAPGDWLKLCGIPALRDFGSGKKLTRLAQIGKISARKVGNTWFVHRDEVTRLISPATNTGK